ncbi:hypothetical protein CSC70_03990 [Pseudoxanthomonas kalamensis DSM 18571]|uniref:hypothetical protein n=1 Tax=Pseudoxanthomonas kalamensis TaxID=289483 RepID=UPI001390E183|nr:hypothetical protein [Pseudoxanthomonas kalamensis]KAF1711097.1 hypothetical protein CSC70_03990 [Pseudoxanthomonas kalamensis DSM 18571]
MTTIPEAADILRAHNEWRRGGDGPQTDPMQLGIAIDVAIEALSAPLPAGGEAVEYMPFGYVYRVTSDTSSERAWNLNETVFCFGAAPANGVKGSIQYLNLYAAPQSAPEPDEMSPDFTDTARAAIAWVLYHHQGGSSPIGQPLRFALGMGAHEQLPDWRIAEAKRYAAWAGSATERFHAAPQPAPAPEPAYDRELSASMLENPHGFAVESMREQARLLREADNATAQARTVVMGEQGGPDDAMLNAERYGWLREHFRFANDSLHELWFDGSLEPNCGGVPADLDQEIDRAMLAAAPELGESNA